jgi:hypothetical protein
VNSKPLVELIAPLLALSLLAGALAYWIIMWSASRAILSSVIRLTFTLSFGSAWLWCLTNIRPWFVGLPASFVVLIVMVIMAKPVGKFAHWLGAARSRGQASMAERRL